MIIYLVAIMLFFTPQDCYAYLDPGSGGLLIQLLLGGVAGLLAILKLYWFNIKAKIKRLFSKG